MKLVNLEKLKSNKMYKDICITSIQKKNSNNLMKEDSILVLNQNSNQLIELLNSKLFKYTYYKNIFTNRIVSNSINSKRLTINLSDYYKDINNQLNQKLIVKKNIQDYQGKNLIIDGSNYLNEFYKYDKRKGISKLDRYIDTIILLSGKFINKYNNLLIVIPIKFSSDKNINVSNFLNLTTLEKESCQYFYQILRNEKLYKKLIDGLRNINPKLSLSFLFTDSTSKYSFKIDTDDETLKLKRSLVLLKTLLKISSSGELTSEEKEASEVDNEEIELDTSKDNINNKKIEKTEEIVDNLISYMKQTEQPSLNSKELDIVEKLTQQVSNIINNDKTIQTKMNNMISNSNGNNSKEEENEINKTILDILDNDNAFKNYLQELKDLQELGSNLNDSKLAKKLQDNQDNIDVNGKTIKDIITNRVVSKEIVKQPIKKEDLLFDNTKNCQIKNYDRDYYKNEFEADIVKSLSSFNEDKDIPLYIESLKIEDTSTDLTLKETYHIIYKDLNGVKHTVNIDIPKVIDDKYIWINGSKKLIQKQLIAKPIIKTKEDTVQVSSYYNKFFIVRFGNKLSEDTEILKKFFINENINNFIPDANKFSYKLGNVILGNKKYPLNIYYSYCSEFLLQIETENMVLILDYDKLLNMLSRENSIIYDSKLSKITYNDDNFQVCGYTKDKNSLILLSREDNKVYSYNNENLLNIGINFNDYLLHLLKSNITEEGIKLLSSFIKPKLLVYNRIMINNNKIPLIVMLGYEFGLVQTLERYKVDYIFSSKLKKPDIMNEYTMRIKFKNGYLYYNNDKVRNSLLLSGLSVLPTEDYNMEECGVNGTIYIEHFSNAYGSRNVGKGIHNNLSLMIDPKTKEILEKLKLPTNIFDILLYANTLLESNIYTSSNVMDNYRLRGVEQINSTLYKLLADSYRSYKDTVKNGNPIKVALRQDAVIKKLIENETVDEASDLNPTLELERISSVTYKGNGGVNLEDSFNEEFRSYSESMLGILGGESPDSNKVGIVRYLTYNPNIINTLGFIDTNNETSNNNTDKYTIAELMNPFTSTHSDPPRTSMQSAQQRHVLEIEDSDKPLFGSGVESTIPYLLSDVFVFKSKQNGKIEKIDTEHNIVILRYEDGTTDVINLNSHMNKNSNSGFYLNSTLTLLAKEGSSFKANEILAKDDMYMVGDTKDSIMYSVGTLSDVAIASSDGTYEDSSFISRDLSERMTSRITMKADMILGVNANVDFIVKENDVIKTGDPLIVFENSFEDSSINELLAKLGADFEQEVDRLSKNTYRSHYTGKVVDIKIFYNRDITEFSPSIQALLNTYISEKSRIRDLLLEYSGKDSMNVTHIPSVGKLDTNKIKGDVLDGIRIEFYIEVKDSVGTGDKIAYFGSCKTIVSDTLEAEEMPVSETNMAKPLDAVFSPLSLVSRMTSDIYNALYLGKTISSLKDIVGDIFKS